jgi:hypothetical protein
MSGLYSSNTKTTFRANSRTTGFASPHLRMIGGLMSTARVGSLWIRATVFVLSVLIAGVASAAKPSGGGHCPAGSQPLKGTGHCIILVTTIIGDVDANGFPATIASDGLGSYIHGVNGVTSWLTSNGYNGIAFGDWQFGVLDSPSRIVNQSLLMEDAVQPGDPHYTAPASPPFGFGTQAAKSHVEVKCTLVNRSMLTMTAGQTFTCPLPNRFAVNGQDYRLDAAYSWTGHPETTDVQVRCNTADANGCNDWFIDPIDLGQAVGRLTLRSNTTVNYGDFYMRLHIHVTRP